MEENKIHHLYKITNKINGKIYIGVTGNLEHRKLCHLRYHGHNRPVNKAVLKYGEENFTFEVICTGSREYIYDLEPKAISLYNSMFTGHGYNLSPGGEGGQGGKRGPIKKRSDDKYVYVSGFWFPNKRTALKSLNWGLGLYQSRKKMNCLGDTYFTAKRHGPQEPVYAMGFWFDSKKTLLEKLNLKDNVYEHRRRNGILGEVIQPPRKSNSTVLNVPNYFKGFWFPNLFIASSIFNKTPESIRVQILRGNFEEDRRKKSTPPRRVYSIEGKPFNSLYEASLEMGVPETTLKNRLSKNYENYEYTYIIEEPTSG